MLKRGILQYFKYIVCPLFIILAQTHDKSRRVVDIFLFIFIKKSFHRGRESNPDQLLIMLHASMLAVTPPT